MLETWAKLPAVKGAIRCSCCGQACEIYPLDHWVVVGYGETTITRDRETLWRESPGSGLDNSPRLSAFEEMAAADPDHDWRMRRHGPLSETVYQRHEPRTWVLVHQGPGFEPEVDACTN